MISGINVITPESIDLPGGLPALVTTAGERAIWHFRDFFTATLRNPNTCEAHLYDVSHFLG